MRTISIVAVILCLFTAPAAAQVRRPPDTCPDARTCELWPYLCENCVPGSIDRAAPVPRLLPDRRVGVTALAADGGYNGIWGGGEPTYPNWVAADEVVGLGMSAVQLWPMVSLTDEHGWWYLPEGDDHRDMTLAIETPGLDLIVIRPMQHSFRERACDGEWSAVWEGGDWGQYAEDLLRKFGNVKKTIVLVNWEGDWQLWGARCREPNECPTGDIWPSRDREEYLACAGDFDCEVAVCEGVRSNRAWYIKRLIDQRRAGIEAARLAHPDAVLSVRLGVVVNHTEDTPQINLTRDVLPFVDLEGVVIGVSHWDRDQTITEALEYIREHLHVARYNTMVAEIGVGFGPDQGDRLFEAVSSAFDWGTSAVFVWSLHQTYWADDLYLIAPDGTTGTGVDGIHKLQEKYER